ncbi:BolA family protein [Brumicola pallidula]|jgi:acid stress-induced BolA-like protein IbaG/YrbA|uniref:BolA-like protein n=1 Tax=Brumicola pallidula DSM 14239 = ACAM 615 TaxID=1121922 RepID=K6Y4N0_9ALTE|nr:BolA/IbaG family iron-sulfur metabolism protein [Glaciecola pallidula]GAC27739.1 BolA-like protein [Glaciecola pallidula DSM 14239 = ACAM 615]
MTNEEIASLLKSELTLVDVKVKSEGSHFQIIAVDNRFEAMPRVKKQQLIYGPLSAKIADGTMHAITIKTFTVDQWQREKLFHS